MKPLDNQQPVHSRWTQGYPVIALFVAIASLAATPVEVEAQSSRVRAARVQALHHLGRLRNDRRVHSGVRVTEHEVHVRRDHGRGRTEHTFRRMGPRQLEREAITRVEYRNGTIAVHWFHPMVPDMPNQTFTATPRSDGLIHLRQDLLQWVGADRPMERHVFAEGTYDPATGIASFYGRTARLARRLQPGLELYHAIRDSGILALD